MLALKRMNRSPFIRIISSSLIFVSLLSPNLVLAAGARSQVHLPFSQSINELSVTAKTYEQAIETLENEIQTSGENNSVLDQFEMSQPLSPQHFKDMESWNKNLSAWYKADKRRSALYDYAAGKDKKGFPIFLSINTKLRTKKALSPKEQDFVNNLNQTLAELPTYSGIAFRGAIFQDSKIIETYKEGTIFTEQGFYSTSVNPQVAFEFAGLSGISQAIFEDHPEAKSALYIISVKVGSAISAVRAYGEKDESEVLIPSGQKFLVKKVLTATDQNHFEIGRAHV